MLMLEVPFTTSIFLAIGSLSGNWAIAGEFDMISSVLAVAMYTMAPDPSPARRTYRTCLTAFMKEALEKSKKPEEFDAGLRPACSAEEEAFRKMAVAYDVGRGIDRKTSQQGVDDEVADFIASEKENYHSEFEARQPTPQ